MLVMTFAMAERKDGTAYRVFWQRGSRPQHYGWMGIGAGRGRMSGGGGRKRKGVDKIECALQISHWNRITGMGGHQLTSLGLRTGHGMRFDLRPLNTYRSNVRHVYGWFYKTTSVILPPC